MFLEVVACVNKRSRHPVCDGDSGAVIEDPLSAQPSLLMLARGGPPEWLKEVSTQICVDRQKGHVIRVPNSEQPIVLDQAVGDRWCTPTVILNYIALQRRGYG